MRNTNNIPFSPRRGSCLGTGHLTLAPAVSGLGEFLAHNNGDNNNGRGDSRIRVLYIDADYTAALLYTCTRPNPDNNGGCLRGHEVITAMSRTRDGLDDTAIDHMLALLQGHCLVRGDFQPVPQTRQYCWGFGGVLFSFFYFFLGVGV